MTPGTGIAKVGIQYRTSLLMRVGQGDKSAIKECISIYGSFIWALAQRMTESREEAEAATEEIFMDLWRYAGRAEKPRFDDNAIVNLIARQRLKTYANHLSDEHVKRKHGYESHRNANMDSK